MKFTIDFPGVKFREFFSKVNSVSGLKICIIKVYEEYEKCRGLPRHSNSYVVSIA